MRSSPFRIALLAIAATAAGRTHAQAQAPAATPTIVLADLAFDGTYANSIVPGDSGMGQVATARLRGVLRDSFSLSLLDSARADAAIAEADRSGSRCGGSVVCARRAGQAAAAAWAVTGTVRKLSNLMWYLSGQVVDVATGRVVLDDGFELKGPRDEMVPRGAESLARRVAKAVVRESDAKAGRSRPRN